MGVNGRVPKMRAPMVPFVLARLDEAARLLELADWRPCNAVAEAALHGRQMPELRIVPLGSELGFKVRRARRSPTRRRARRAHVDTKLRLHHPERAPEGAHMWITDIRVRTRARSTTWRIVKPTAGSRARPASARATRTLSTTCSGRGISSLEHP